MNDGCSCSFSCGGRVGQVGWCRVCSSRDGVFAKVGEPFGDPNKDNSILWSILGSPD